MPQQDFWRYCDKCHVMFFNGYTSKGNCPAGGGHEAQGYLFELPYDNPPSATVQGSWRFCDKCSVMFFDGYADKGHCPAGGGHQSQGYMFALPHNIPATPTTQSSWRYCEKCHGMFYDGYANKGNCPAGGGHQSQGYMFVLPHDQFPVPVQSTTWGFNDFNAGHISVHGNSLTFSSNGAWHWTAALHDDSTFYGDNYAIGFAFNHLGHGAATSGSLGASLSGPSQNGTVDMSGTDAWLAGNYAAAVNASATCSLKVSGDIGQLFSGILSDLGQAAGDVLQFLSGGDGEDSGDDGDDGDDGGGDDGGGDVGEEEIKHKNLDPHPTTVSASSAALKAA
jgi:hypothetical protein